MKLFDHYGRGSEELVAALGLISTGISFDKWTPLLPLGIRDVKAIVGADVVDTIIGYYEHETCPDCLTTALQYLQKSVAYFTWLKVIPTLDAQHDESGRSRRLGENEKGLTALQEFKDEENIRRLAYESVDALVEELDRVKPDFWTTSAKYAARSGLLIRSREDFDEYYVIGSNRLFVTLTPIIREIQDTVVAPVLGPKCLAALLGGERTGTYGLINATACRAIALLTIRKAVERLPVEVIPEGVVQVQQSQPVKSRLKAEQAARVAVAASLGADAQTYLHYLQQLVATLDNTGSEPAETYIPGPIVHSKGMTF